MTRQSNRHTLSILAVSLGLHILLFVPQIANIWKQRPSVASGVLYWFWAFVLLVAYYYIGSLATFVPGGFYQPENESVAMRFTRCFFFPVDWLMNRLIVWFPKNKMFRRCAAVACLTVGLVLLVVGLFVPRVAPEAFFYLLDYVFFKTIGLWFLFAGFWYLFAAWRGTDDLTVRIQGRFLTWIVAGHLVGEFIWIAASTGHFVLSYRNYTIWAAVHFLAVFWMLARLLDAWSQIPSVAWPVRWIGCLVLAVVALCSERPQTVRDVRFERLGTTVVAARGSGGRQAHVGQTPPTEQVVLDCDIQLRNRIAELPEGEPVVVVAATGGGSRAALFTALVLEALAREPLESGASETAQTTEADTSKRATWADRIVLLSAVSGGSLATAHFVHQSMHPSSWPPVEEGVRSTTTRGDLIDALANWAVRLGKAESQGGQIDLDREQIRELSQLFQELQRLRNEEEKKELSQLQRGAESTAKRFLLDYVVDLVERQLGAYREKPTSEFVAELCEFLRDHPRSVAVEPGSPGRLGWLVDARLVDDVSMDFMAPVLRGACSPTDSRGDTLMVYWNRQFVWDGSTNRTGYGSLAEGQPASYQHRIQTTSGEAGAVQHHSPVVFYNACDAANGTRLVISFPPLPRQHDVRVPYHRTLEDLIPRDTISRVSLARAVRMSSNFPFGFQMNRLQMPEYSITDRVDVTDGGVVDNTGIDSVYEFFRRLDREAAPGTIASDIMQLLQKRGIVLVIIDSGTQRDLGPQSLVNWLFEGLVGPLDALSNAAHSSADRAKKTYFANLDRMFAGRIPFHRVSFACHYLREPASVMTAWTLGPNDKASVFARFLFTWRLRKAELSICRRIIRQQLDTLHEAATQTLQQRELVKDLQQVFHARAQREDAYLQRKATQAKR